MIFTSRRWFSFRKIHRDVGITTPYDNYFAIKISAVVKRGKCVILNGPIKLGYFTIRMYSALTMYTLLICVRVCEWRAVRTDHFLTTRLINNNSGRMCHRVFLPHQPRAYGPWVGLE